VIAGAVTTRYTEALFRLALRTGVLDAVSGDVESIAREVGVPHVSARLFDARIDVSRRREMLAPLLATLSPMTRNFVELLFDKRREGVLAELGAAWHRRSLAERGAAEGVVESARPLATAELERLAAALGKRLGLEVELENRINPELIDGVRAVVENRMIDCSVQGRLEGLGRKLMDAPLSVASGQS